MALLSTIVAQPAGLAKTVILNPSRRSVIAELGRAARDVEEKVVEPDWSAQALGLAGNSGCRWVVFPSTVDRYLPGAFQAIADARVTSRRSLVAPCVIERNGRTMRPGPAQFGFDYFWLLSGFNYVAPGAAMFDIGVFVERGGFDPRYPNAAVFEYLLRIGPGNGVVAALADPIVRTEASPFPGIPADCASHYAVEATSATLRYHRHVLTPGSVLGLAAVLAGGVRPMRATGYYDEELIRRLAGGAVDFPARYLSALDQAASGEETRAARLWRMLRPRAKAVTPGWLWNVLHRSKRAWQAFREPL